MLALCASAALGGCGALEIDVPEGFLQLGTWGGELKATTPDEARLWVREFADPDGGSVGFWAETLRNDLVQSRGYVLVREGEVRDASGRQGSVQVYDTNAAGEPHGYLVAVFVRERWWQDDVVRVVEFAARKPVFEARAAAVERALATLRP